MDVLRKDLLEHIFKIIDAVPVSIYLKDLNQKYIGCNTYMLKMAGVVSRNDIIGKKDKDLIWKDISKNLETIDHKVMNERKVYKIEESPVISTDKKKIYLTTKTPLYDLNNNVIGLIGVSVDITERKNIEKKLKKSKEQAESANKAKTEFLNNMRHDIRTPIQGLIGVSQIIQEETNESKIKEYADKLIVSGNSLLKFLNDILDSISVDSGIIPTVRKRFNLKETLYDIIQLHEAKAEQKNLTLKLIYDKKLPKFFIGDPIRINRILLELVSNALNFTNTGMVKVLVEKCRGQSSKSNNNLIIKFIVLDTGIGMSEKEQSQIFVRFKKIVSSYKGIYDGAGLGLSIAKQFIDDLKGEISVESIRKKGTKFTFLIPLQKALEQIPYNENKQDILEFSIRRKINKKIKMNIKTGKTSNRKVLVVEDDKISAIVVQNFLTGFNYESVLAENGQQAINLFKKGNYDLIIIDIGLPDIDGYQVAKQIRKIETKTKQHTPIVALTGHDDNNYKKAGTKMGMDAFLVKPLKREKLAKILALFFK